MKQKPEVINSIEDDLVYEILFTFETEEGITLALCKPSNDDFDSDVEEVNISLFGYQELDNGEIELFDVGEEIYEKYKDDMFSYAEDFFEGDDYDFEEGDDFEDEDDDDSLDFIDIASEIVSSNLDSEDEDVCEECGGVEGECCCSEHSNKHTHNHKK